MFFVRDTISDPPCRVNTNEQNVFFFFCIACREERNVVVLTKASVLAPPPRPHSLALNPPHVLLGFACCERSVFVWATRPFHHTHTPPPPSLSCFDPAVYLLSRTFDGQSARHWSFGMDMLVVVGTSVSYLYSSLALLLACSLPGDGEKRPLLFLESPAMLLTFIVLGILVVLVVLLYVVGVSFVFFRLSSFVFRLSSFVFPPVLAFDIYGDVGSALPSLAHFFCRSARTQALALSTTTEM